MLTGGGEYLASRLCQADLLEERQSVRLTSPHQSVLLAATDNNDIEQTVP